MPSEASITISEKLVTAGTGPASASSDAGSVTQQSLESLITLDKYLAAKDAASGAGRGLRFSRLVPDGTTAGRCRTRGRYRW